MNATTLLILLIAAGSFSVLIWFRDRVVRWRSIAFGLVMLLVFGLIDFATTLLVLLSPDYDKPEVSMLGDSVGFLALLAGLVFFIQALLPKDVVIHKLWPGFVGDDEAGTGPPPAPPSQQDEP